MYAVIVTYGTVVNQVYAGAIRDFSDAEKLQDAAIERGYRDARIEREKDFYATRPAYSRGSARAPAAA